ncbi:TLC domain-containing protein 5-like isoform X2 [Pararge aegeria]|uniref:TLC domain-containing protein 5-like isoform X2 n=1 Tax=Pararge aegeria TaxID=116150 RepID=UPI0019D120BB|nr:TLC domain-containing protein 5-like isoform X2 [Pararge aegeria]
MASHELSTASLLKLCSFAFWGWSYIWVTNAAPKKSPEWHSRMVTLLHGSIATLVGVHQCGITSVDQCRLTMKISYGEYALMLWSWGYFAFDLLWCLVYMSNSLVILAHHLTALIAVNIYLSKAYAGCTFACTLALMEITNPFLQTRWLLRYEGYGQTLIFYLVEIIYFVMFLTIRAFFCTYLVFEMLNSDFLDMDEKIISVSLYIVSLILVYEILSYVTYKYKNKIVRGI